MEFHLLRIEGIKDALLEGQFPVRIHPNFLEGYGYSTPIYYPELFLYFPALLRVIGFPILKAYKIMIFAENILTAGIAYGCAKRLLGDKKLALLVSCLYTLSAYRLVNLYYRAAVGEAWAMTFLPILVCSICILLKKDAIKSEIREASILLMLGVTGIMQSHILTCEMAVIFMILVSLIYVRRLMKIRKILAILIAVLGTICLNVWFIVPFLQSMREDIKVLQMTNSSIGKVGLTIYQLFAFNPKACGKSESLSIGISGEMPLYLGFSLVIGIGIILYKFGQIWKTRSQMDSSRILGCTLFAAVALWMATYLFPWDLFNIIPKLGKIMYTVQFPWRYLGIASLLLCFAIVGSVRLYRNKNILSIVLAGTAVIVAMMFYQSMIEHTPYYAVYESNGLDSGTVVGGEYLYRGTDLEKLKEFTYDSDCIKKTGTNLLIDVSKTNQQQMLLPLLYSPYYEAKDCNTGEKMLLTKGENNMLCLSVLDEYQGTISVYQKESATWIVADCISILSILGLAVFVFYAKGKYK